MENPINKLYHYTSINNLALILKSKSIRFGRLDKVNDPLEGLSSDFHQLSHYVFISSWTANEKEDFALWNMYTQNMRGVRIEMELPIFQSYCIDEMDNLLFKEEDYLNEDIGYCIIGGLNEPHIIEYVDDENLLKPAVRNEFGINIGSVGKYKKSIWIVEQEYRFRLEMLPIDKSKQSDYFPDRYETLIENKIPAPVEDYFIRLTEEAFGKMKIVCGPKLHNGDKEIIKALIKTYNPTAEIKESTLAGLIR